MKWGRICRMEEWIWAPQGGLWLRIQYVHSNRFTLLRISAVGTACSFDMEQKFLPILNKPEVETGGKLNFETHLSVDLRKAGTGSRVSRHIQEMRRQVETAL